jgi:formylglycine-generating enzyme
MLERLVLRCLVVACAPLLLPAATHAMSITHGTTTINMEFVTIGNAGNAGEQSRLAQYADPTYYGGVDYAYQIGKYEVTENQWDAVVAADRSDLLDDAGYWSGNQPVASITWNQVAMFCNWLTSGSVRQGAYTVNSSGAVTGINRDNAERIYGTVYVMPTENEWYKAAYYDPSKGGTRVPGYWDYPTKQDAPNVPDGIDFAGDTTFDAVCRDGYDQRHPNDVDNAGVPSAYGTVGQGGNVDEWNETASGTLRRVRGGYWNCSSSCMQSSSHYQSVPHGESFSFGFRVVCVPEPGSITMVICGATVGLIWWRCRR